MNLLIFANGPGELSERAVPFVRLVKQDIPNGFNYLVLTPCQFSSGNESIIAKNFNLFDGVFSLGNLSSLLSFFVKKKIDVILHLGGDIIYPRIFSLVLDTKCFSYGSFFVRDKRCKYIIPYPSSISQSAKRGIPFGNIFFGGNFSFCRYYLADSFSFSKNGGWKVGLFPGSRRLQFEHILPFFVKTLDYLYESGYNLKPKLFLSPFIDINFLIQVVKQGPTYKVLDYSKIDMYRDGKNFYLLSEMGYKIDITSSLEEMESLDIALTTPGTSTLTLSNFGIPMLVVAPFNKIEKIPLNGIANFIEYIPYFGPFLKRKLVYNYLMNREFLALPNIIENREIVKEIKGVLTFYDVGESLKKMISSRKDLYKIRRELLAFSLKYKLRKTKIIEELKRYV